MRCGVHSIESYNDFGVCVCTHFANRVFFFLRANARLRQFGVKHSILNIFNYWCSGAVCCITAGHSCDALRCIAIYAYMKNNLQFCFSTLQILLLSYLYTLFRCNREANKYRYLYGLCNDYGAQACDTLAMYYGNGCVHELSKHREWIPNGLKCSLKQIIPNAIDSHCIYRQPDGADCAIPWNAPIQQLFSALRFVPKETNKSCNARIPFISHNPTNITHTRTNNNKH